jgi:hypothetical protein
VLAAAEAGQAPKAPHKIPKAAAVAAAEACQAPKAPHKIQPSSAARRRASSWSNITQILWMRLSATSMTSATGCS